MTILFKVLSEWFDEYGPIVRISIPERIFVKNPATIKTVLSMDGKNPIEPGFDHIVHYRQNLRKDIFHQTAGLLGSHGESWYNVRSKVNFQYIENLNKILLSYFLAGSTGYAETQVRHGLHRGH